MSFRTVLVPVNGTEPSRAILETGYLVSRMFEAHLEVLHVRLDPRNAIPYVGDGLSGAMIEEVMRAAEREGAQRAQRARRMFDEFCTTHGVPVVNAPPSPNGVSAGWREETGREEDGVARRGRLNDVIVVGRPTRDSEQVSSMTLEAALLDARRPVLVAPPIVPSSLGRTVVIAWNGSVEAGRAITAGVYLMKQAERVVIMAAEEETTNELPARDVVNYLAWHDIAAETVVVKPTCLSVGEALLEETARIAGDLLIMGAYSRRSRLRQMFFGGVTSYVLSTAELPVLMRH